MDMRKTSMIILLAILMTFSLGQVLSQDALNVTNTTNVTAGLNITNATNVTNDTNVTSTENATPIVVPVIEAPVTVAETPSAAAPENVTETAAAAPQETASRFKQLSNYTKGASAVLGKSIPSGYSDVTKAADTDVVFSREPGVPAPSVKVNITDVNTEGDKYVQIANLAIGAWDLTGWKLVSAGNTTYTFPPFSLENGLSVKVHEGSGSGTATDMYTNNTAPLWIDNVVALQDATGNVISAYDISKAPTAPAKYVDPLAGRIQY
jgi:Lamin Tail Domain